MPPVENFVNYFNVLNAHELADTVSNLNTDDIAEHVDNEELLNERKV